MNKISNIIANYFLIKLTSENKNKNNIANIIPKLNVIYSSKIIFNALNHIMENKKPFPLELYKPTPNSIIIHQKKTPELNIFAYIKKHNNNIFISVLEKKPIHLISTPEQSHNVLAQPNKIIRGIFNLNPVKTIKYFTLYLTYKNHQKITHLYENYLANFYNQIISPK